MLLELLVDADAVILDAELVIAAALGRTGLLGNADAHHAAGGGELDSIGKDVQQHLIQPQRVGDDILVHHIHGVDEQRQPFGTDVGLDDGAYIVHEIRQMHRLFLDLHLAALDAAHVQHIVDEGEQVLAGGGDLFQVVQHLFLIINMGRRQRGEADNGVHRGADVVAHVEQELPLGAVCRCLVPDGKLQLAVLLFQLGVILPLLLFPLLLRSRRRAAAQRLQHCHTDQIEDQCSQQCAAGIAEHRFFVDIEIQIKILSVAVHPEIAAGICPVAGVGQNVGRTGLADALHQRAVRGVQSDEARVVCGDHLVVLHDKDGAADVLRVAVQHALDGQGCPLHKLRRGHPVSQQHGVPCCGAAGGNIHRCTIL